MKQLLLGRDRCVVDHQVVDRQVVDHQVVDHQVVDHQVVDHQVANPEPKPGTRPRTRKCRSGPENGAVPNPSYRSVA